MERVCLIDNETVQNLHFPLYRATGDIVKVSICAVCFIVYFKSFLIQFGIGCGSVDEMLKLVSTVNFHNFHTGLEFIVG
jgi:hypothetical protein